MLLHFAFDVQYPTIIKHITNNLSLPKGSQALPLVTNVSIIQARDMPAPLLSRTLDKGWVQQIFNNFRPESMRPGQLIVDASDYKREFPEKRLTNIPELQAAIDHYPAKFKLYPAAGRYVVFPLKANLQFCCRKVTVSFYAPYYNAAYLPCVCIRCCRHSTVAAQQYQVQHLDTTITRMWDVVWLADSLTVAEAVVIGTINNVQQAEEESMVSATSCIEVI